MSSTVRTGIVFGIAATLAFIGGILIPLGCLNFVIAFGSVIALGWGAGYSASKATHVAQGTGQGLIAGAIAGAVLLIISTIGFGLLTSQPIVASVSEPLVAIVGSFAGFSAGLMLGLINLVLMAAAGVFGGFMWRGRRASRTQNE